MTTPTLHQTAAGGAMLSTLELIPTPSQPGQHHNNSQGNQPTHEDNESKNKSETETAGPQLFVITEMRSNAGGDALAIIDRTGGDALQTCLNQVPGSSLLLLHSHLNRLCEL